MRGCCANGKFFGFTPQIKRKKIILVFLEGLKITLTERETLFQYTYEAYRMILVVSQCLLIKVKV